MSRLSVASQYAPLYLSTWLGGKAKVTVCWRVLGWLTTMAMLLALAWLVGLRCAIGCVPVSGLDALTTLGSGAGVCMHTLGVDAGVGAGNALMSLQFHGPALSRQLQLEVVRCRQCCHLPGEKIG